jgi:glucuronoarabinoxylan endo-1,4-beta-xylanase
MKWFRILGFLLTLAVCQRVQAQTATVTWTTTYQTMDGWGGEDWWGTASTSTGGSGFALTSTEAAQFFSPTTGIGLEFIRTGDYYCPNTGSCAVSTASVPDLTTLKEASADGALVTVHIQPPANLQYGGVFTAGTPDPATGNCIDSSNWTAFANFTVSWIEMLQANSVPVYDVEVANEPNLNQTDTLGACVWSASGLDSYIKGYLGPALSAAGLSTKIATPQSSDWFNTDLASTCLNDSSCAAYVSIANGHGYGSGSQDGMGTGYCCLTATAPPSSTSGKRVWMSETNGGFTYDSAYATWAWDTSMADALVWARSIHDYLTIANANAWFYWELLDFCGANYSDGCVDGPYNDGLAISTGGGQTPTDLAFGKRYYTIGNWSKFVRTGWVRIGATASPVSGVFVTAFNQTSSNSFAIVAVNTNNSDTSVSFNLSGFPASPSCVTPWITSSTLSLAQQSNVSVTDGSFAYVLPADSVTSLVGNTTTAAAPAPPSQLVATVE